MSSLKGERITFLISQPRSGSTLLQRMLGSHSAIHTQSEPWVMLHPMHALKPDRIDAKYNAYLYRLGLNDFINEIPGGMETYKNAISRTYEEFYYSILDNNDKTIFLDKTPRYYQTIKELYDFFSNAKFIFLLRNPAAVFCSIYYTWVEGQLSKLALFQDDLLEAPRLILEGIECVKENGIVVQYEKLVSHPIEELERICMHLGIPYESKMLHYNTKNDKKWKFGDQNAVYSKERPDIIHIDAWKSNLTDANIWQFIHEYLNILGSEMLNELGYSFDQILQDLESYIPNPELLNKNGSLLNWMSKGNYFASRNTELEILLEEKDVELSLKQNQINDIAKKLKNQENLIRVQKDLISKSNLDLEHIKNSMSFKLGHLLLQPFRIFKKYI